MATLTKKELDILKDIEVSTVTACNCETYVYFKLPYELKRSAEKTNVRYCGKNGKAVGKLVLEEYENGLYGYGYYSFEGLDGHGADYRWSSNADTINKAFHTEMNDIIINSCSYTCRKELFVAICEKCQVQVLPDTDGISNGLCECYNP